MINLIPDDHREQIRYGRKNSQTLIWLSTVAFGVAVLLVVALVGRLTIQTAKNQTLSQRTAVEVQISDANLDAVEKEYNTFVNGVSSVKKVYQRQILYSRLIRKMATLLPPGARLTTISLSDKDRALNLNFDNDVDGLGPTIQVNLENQGTQIAEQNRLLTENGFRIKTGGKLEILSDGSQRTVISVDSSKKTVEYYVSIVDNPDSKEDSLDTYLSALNNGGEYAFALVKQSLSRDGYLYMYESAQEDRSRIPEGNSLPQMTSYKVDETSKSVDFTIRANDLTQAKSYEQALNTAGKSLFIETYAFEDSNYTLKSRCTDKLVSKTTCKAVCPGMNPDCTIAQKVCEPIDNIGCQFIVRAYYDELFTSAKAEKLDESTQKSVCPLATSGYSTCSHKITATYEPLFEKVDINRITSCSTEQTTGVQSCPVEMRAEFGANAKFYLVNVGGTP